MKKTMGILLGITHTLLSFSAQAMEEQDTGPSRKADKIVVRQKISEVSLKREQKYQKLDNFIFIPDQGQDLDIAPFLEKCAVEQDYPQLIELLKQWKLAEFQKNKYTALHDKILDFFQELDPEISTQNFEKLRQLHTDHIILQINVCCMARQIPRKTAPVHQEKTDLPEGVLVNVGKKLCKLFEQREEGELDLNTGVDPFYRLILDRCRKKLFLGTETDTQEIAEQRARLLAQGFLEGF